LPEPFRLFVVFGEFDMKALKRVELFELIIQRVA